MLSLPIPGSKVLFQATGLTGVKVTIEGLFLLQPDSQEAWLLAVPIDSAVTNGPKVTCAPNSPDQAIVTLVNPAHCQTTLARPSRYAAFQNYVDIQHIMQQVRQLSGPHAESPTEDFVSAGEVSAALPVDSITRMQADHSELAKTVQSQQAVLGHIESMMKQLTMNPQPVATNERAGPNKVSQPFPSNPLLSGLRKQRNLFGEDSDSSGGDSEDSDLPSASAPKPQAMPGLPFPAGHQQPYIGQATGLSDSPFPQPLAAQVDPNLILMTEMIKTMKQLRKPKTDSVQTATNQLVEMG